MQNTRTIQRVVDLTDASKNVIYNMADKEARDLLASGETNAVRSIDGQFALAATKAKTVRLARSIGRPLHYFIVKRADGPRPVAADCIDSILDFF